MNILIIEGRPDVLLTLIHVLHEEGYTVDTALDCETGAHKSKSNSYSAIILDATPMKVNGFETLCAIRRENKTVPLLLLIARDNPADKVLGLNAGADDCLTMPYDLNELLARLKALIRRCSICSIPILRIGDIAINTALKVVSRDNNRVTLTAREYDVAEYLAMRRGKIIPRVVLHRKILDEEDDAQSNLVDVYIYNLRKKLGADFIHTRRGVGYWVP